MSKIENVAVAGVGTVPSQRKPPPETSTPSLLAEALVRALADAGARPGDIDGLGVASFSLVPDRAVDLAWHLGLRLSWVMEDVLALNLLHHAVRAIESGDADVIALVGGDHLLGAGYGAMVDAYNVVTRDYLSPTGVGGPNALLALVTQEHMARHGLGREAYGEVVVRQRAWASTNPNAAYRTPLTMREYLDAPVVADPLVLFDCPPVVSGAEAIIVTAGDRSPAGRRLVEIRTIRSSFNHDDHEGDGLTTGLAPIAARLWEDSGIGPADVDVVEVYDDYPVIVLAQLDDLGLAGHRAVNTGGGLLAAGQAGAGGGLHGLVEATRQLRHERSDGQVAGARFAAVAGYGMILYRYGACSVGAVLEGSAAR